MSEQDAVPRHVEPERTIGSRTAVLEDVRARLENDIRDLRAELMRTAKDIREEQERKFNTGHQSFEALRTDQKLLKEQLEGRVSTRLASVAIAHDTKLEVVARDLEAFKREVAPRATSLRLFGWASSLIGALATAGYLYLSKPDKSELRELENRLRVAESGVTECRTILGARGATP